ncbi:DNA polymerase III subunit beta [Bacteroidota bacterium]
MKFKVALSTFQIGLQKVVPALPRKSTLPVLEHIHFSLNDDVLQIIATDQDITIQTTVNVEGEMGGEILVPGRRLIEMVKALGTEGALDFSTNDDNYEITIQTKNPVGRYSMKGLSHTEFLRIPELVESAKPNVDENGVLIKGENKLAAFFKQEDITKIATKTVYAVSTDEFRPAMNGVFFQFRENYLNAVATDSFRLVKAVLKHEQTEYPKDLDIIMPARAMEVLKKVDGDLIMSFIDSRGKKTHARFDFGDSVFISRLIDENFPPYESVIPEDSEFKVLLNQSELLAAVNRVSILTSEISHQIRVHLENNTFTVLGEDEETGAHAVETLNCDYTGNHFEIAFNSRYLKDAVENLGGETKDDLIEIRFTEQNRPVILKPNIESEDLLMLIMPVRLR